MFWNGYIYFECIVGEGLLFLLENKVSLLFNKC